MPHHREANSTRALIEVVHNELASMTLTREEAPQLASALLILAGTTDRPWGATPSNDRTAHDP